MQYTLKWTSDGQHENSNLHAVALITRAHKELETVLYSNNLGQTHTVIMNYLRFQWQSVTWTSFIMGQTLMYGAYSIMVNLSKVNGELPFFSSSLILITECVKLLICLVLLTLEWNKLPVVPLCDVLRFGIPAGCYTFNNNLSVFMQTEMDAATYMVLGNFKTLTTGLLYQLIMKKSLSNLQWFSLGLLTIGGAMSSLTALDAPVKSLSDIHCTRVGLFAMAIYCVVSGFAGVYTEYQLKTRIQMSLSYQNALLYSFGIIFNFALWIWQNLHQREESKIGQSFNIFHGFSPIVWLLVFTQCAVGLGTSVIVKHKSNLTRLFVISSAPVVTTFLSYTIFNLHLQPLFILASIIVAIAIVLYNLEKVIDIDLRKPDKISA